MNGENEGDIVANLKDAAAELRRIYQAYRTGQASFDDVSQARVRYRKSWERGVHKDLFNSQA